MGDEHGRESPVRSCLCEEPSAAADDSGAAGRRVPTRGCRRIRGVFLAVGQFWGTISISI
jgi:hypothetical protein